LALPGDGQLPTLLDRADAFGRVDAQALQDHEGDQDEAHVADPRRLATSSTNSTYSRCSSSVLAVNKSTASTLLAWARRNCRQVNADRLGAGSTPARWRMAQTVLAPILSL
jgi:hypothetical protein